MFYPTSLKLWRSRQDISDSIDWFVAQNRAAGTCSGGRAEAIAERMPYLALTERRKQWARYGMNALNSRFGPNISDPAVMAALQKVTVFKGVAKPSDEPDDVVEAAEDGGPKGGKWDSHVEKSVEWVDGGAQAVESLVLSDDDIEDF